MTEVFISYSRRDKEFVRRLHEALLAQKRDVWVDWEDIPPTADWRAEIRGGIDATNAMIFVISPDSARSKECRVELELALENNKRLIPLMYRTVTEPADQQAMHPSLNSHNWIYLRDEDPFEEGFQTVLKALDTDLAYVREHTRLLVRAREWDAQKRDTSLLLRGSDLIEAEKWLAGALEAKPAPAQLHSDYIRASREAEIVRSRRLLGGVMMALLVSLILGVFALVQWQQSASNLALANTRGTEVAQQAATSDSNALLALNNAATADANAVLAQNNEATAVYNEGRARSIALAGQSQLDVGKKDPERGVMLALEALKNYPYTAQAEYALGLAIDNIISNLVFPGAAAFETNAYWAPDGQRLAVINEKGSIDVWEIDTGALITTLSQPDNPLYKASWSPDGSRITTTGVDGRITIWDENWQEQFKIDGVGALWSPDGTQIATYDTQFSVWDAATGERLYVEGSGDVFSNFYEPMAYSPDGTRLALGNVSGVVMILNAVDGTKQVEWAADEQSISAVSWSPDGSRLITGSGNLSATDENDQSAYLSSRVWDSETGKLIWTLSDKMNSSVVNALWSPDGTQIMISNFEGANVYDAETGEFQFGFAGFYPQWSPDSTAILAGSVTNNQATVYDAISGQVLSVFTSHSASVIGVAWSPDGGLVSTASIDGTVRVWDLYDSLTQIVLPGNYLLIEWAADGQALWAMSDSDGHMQLWDVESGTQLAESQGVTLAVTTVGETYYLIGDEMSNDLSVVDADNNVISTFSDHSSILGAVNWLPNGKEIATADQDDQLFVWNPQSGEKRLELKGHDVEWSPDGKRLLVISYADGQEHQAVSLYDATTGEIQSTLPLGTDANGLTTVPFALWSPDGTKVATTLEQGIGTTDQIDIWDAVTTEHLYTLHGKQFSWSPDGERMAIAQNDGTVSIETLNGDLVYSIIDPNVVLYDVAWSPNSDYVATIDRNATVKVWGVWPTTEALLTYAQDCCIARDFTEAERQQFGLTDVGG